MLSNRIKNISLPGVPGSLSKQLASAKFKMTKNTFNLTYMTKILYMQCTVLSQRIFLTLLGTGVFSLNKCFLSSSVLENMEYHCLQLHCILWNADLSKDIFHILQENSFHALIFQINCSLSRCSRFQRVRQKGTPSSMLSLGSNDTKVPIPTKE